MARLAAGEQKASDVAEAKEGSVAVDSKQVHAELVRLLSFCREKKVLQLFDGKVVDDTVQTLIGVTFAVLQTEALAADDKVELIHENIDSLVGEDNSCGAASNRVCALLLGLDNTMGDPSVGYMTAAKQVETLARMEADDFPRLLRIEVGRKNGGGWMSSHSFTVMLHNSSDIHMLQAYFGEHTLADWVAMPKSAAVSEMDMETYLYKLLDLESDDEDERAMAYEELFIDGASADEHPEYRVSCRSEKINPESAMSNIAALKAAVLTSCKHPALAAGVGFKALVQAEIYQRQSATLTSVGLDGMQAVLDDALAAEASAVVSVCA